MLVIDQLLTNKQPKAVNQQTANGMVSKCPCNKMAIK